MSIDPPAHRQRSVTHWLAGLRYRRGQPQSGNLQRVRPQLFLSSSGSGPMTCADQVAELAQAAPGESDRVALTMTAELCDCYPTRAVGVLAVLDAVEEAFPVGIFASGEPTNSSTRRGGDSKPTLDRRGRELAGLWYAGRPADPTRAGTGHRRGLDHHRPDPDPIDGVPLPRGRTDTERLATGELVYAGVIRTPVCALAPRFPGVRARSAWPPSSSPQLLMCT